MKRLLFINLLLLLAITNAKGQDNYTYEGVDLGLPSGTIWATMNYGSECPEDWGYDVSYNYALESLPNGWRLPTAEQYAELKTKCKWKYVKREDTQGWLVTSRRNKNSIFLPAIHFSYGWIGKYWVYSPDVNRTGYPIMLNFGSKDMSFFPTLSSASIRPVRAR